MDATEKAALMARARRKAQDTRLATDIPASARILAIASGKGGVGKSSVTANLAVSLAARGLTVGVLDADIWGFCLPRMLGLEGRVAGRGPQDGADRAADRATACSKVLSMGLIGGAAEDQAIMWRGLILNRAVQHFLEDVRWGDLDYLLIDMPPGTGDVQMGLARMLPRADMIIVTTPALAAQKVAVRAADMARKGYLRVAGVVENMTAFTLRSRRRVRPVRRAAVASALADELGVPLLGQVPIEPAVARGGRRGPAGGAGRRAGGRRLPRPSPSRSSPRSRRSWSWPAARPACSTPSRRRSPRHPSRPASRGPGRGHVVGVASPAARPSAASLRRWAHTE